MEPPSRHWLVAAFLLHFMLSVLMMGSGVQAGESSERAGAMSLSAVGGGGDAFFDADHGLGDHQPDLPDSLQRRASQRQSGRVVSLPPAYRTQRLPTPALSVPMKPPQRA